MLIKTKTYFNMKVNSEILDALDDYHLKSLLMQKFLYEGNKDNLTKEELKEKVNDDLVFYVPIYDMLDRRYAAFSSFLEALDKKENDPKGNGIRFMSYKEYNILNKLMLYYLFRLCGSGINYIPGTHGFGNFWIVKCIENGRYNIDQWFEDLPENKFSNNKGYLLPQFSIGLRNFILNYSLDFISYLRNELKSRQHTIIEFVDKGNYWLRSHNFKKQNFVLSAFAADIAEYHPELIYQKSMIYAGTNAKKCIKAIFGKCDEFEAIQFLADRYKSTPYSVEDSRLCDPVRYFLDYQSKYHIEKNNGKIFYNNSILKKIWNQNQYNDFLLRLRN